MSFPPNTISIRDQVVPVVRGRTLFDMLRAIGTTCVEAAMNSDGTFACLKSDDDAPLSMMDEASTRAARACLQAQDMRISALLLATDFSSEAADNHMKFAIRMVQQAAHLEVPVVRIDPWTANQDLPAETLVDHFVACVRRLLDQTADCTVDIGMENHGQIFNDPQVLDEVLAAIPDSRFGLTLDTGNLYWWGHPISRVYELIERYASRTKHTHIKNIHYPVTIRESQREIGFEYKQSCCPLYDGDLDLRRIVNILRSGGYQRDLCVEDESLFKASESDHIEILRREVDALRNALPAELL
jgi:sugar phosphate isomerase/epimerase